MLEQVFWQEPWPGEDPCWSSLLLKDSTPRRGYPREALESPSDRTARAGQAGHWISSGPAFHGKGPLDAFV